MLQIILLVWLVCLSSIAQADLLDLSEHGDFKKIYFIPEASADNVEVRLFLPVGEADRTGPEGLAHYLEHLVVWSADKVHGEGFRNREMNAWTSPFWTAYWNRGPKDSLENMLRNARAVFEPVQLDQDFMLTERDVVEREFDLRYRDNPSAVLYREAFRHLYGDHGFGRSVMGTPDSLRQLPIKEALAFHQQRYNAQDAYLLMSGPATKEQIIGQIEEHLRGLPKRAASARGFASPLPRPPSSSLTLDLPELEREQVLFVGQAQPPVGFSTRKIWFSLLLLEDILNSSLQGGLAKPLYYDSFTVTKVRANLYMLPTGDIGYEFFFSPEDGISAQQALSRVQNVLNQLADDSIPVETLKSLRGRTLEQVRRFEKDDPRYATTIAQQSILNLGEALDVKTYHYELGRPRLSDLTAILTSIVASPFATTAIANPELSQ